MTEWLVIMKQSIWKKFLPNQPTQSVIGAIRASYHSRKKLQLLTKAEKCESGLRCTIFCTDSMLERHLMDMINNEKWKYSVYQIDEFAE
jgi:hypothetical protein